MVDSGLDRRARARGFRWLQCPDISSVACCAARGDQRAPRHLKRRSHREACKYGPRVDVQGWPIQPQTSARWTRRFLTGLGRSDKRERTLGERAQTLPTYIREAISTILASTIAMAWHLLVPTVVGHVVAAAGADHTLGTSYQQQRK